MAERTGGSGSTTGFVRDFASLAGRKGLAVLGAITVLAPVVTFIASSDLGLAATAVCAVLLVAAVMAAHAYWRQLQAAIRGIDLSVTFGRLRLFEGQADAEQDGFLIVVPGVRITTALPTTRSPLGSVSSRMPWTATASSNLVPLERAAGSCGGVPKPL